MGRPRPLRLPRRPGAHGEFGVRRIRSALVIDAGVVAAIVGAFLAATTQGVTGVGFSLVIAPVLTLTIGADRAVPMINLMAGCLNIGMLYAERQHARWKDAAALLIPAAIVIPIVGFAIRGLSTDTLSVLVGAGILVSALLMWLGARAPALRGRGGAVFAGGVSGAMNVASSVGGPPAAMYAINAEWPPESFRPTLQVHFLGMNILSLAVRVFPSGADFGVMAAMAPAIALGWFAGSRLASRVNHDAVKKLTLLVAAAGGAAALIRGAFGG